MEIYNIENLTKQYKERIVLDNLSFKIPKGKITAILGRNGAGKTTIIKLLLGLIYPTKGQIFFDGKRIDQYRNNYYSRVSAILEATDNIYSFLTGKQNIDYFLNLSKSKLTFESDYIQQMISAFDLSHHINKVSGQYSRGMIQKLSLIIALVSEADVLFLDEPTLGVDFQSTNDICDCLKTLSKEDGKTIILTSHQSNIIEDLADYVILIDNQKILFEGTYDQFVSKGTFESDFKAVINTVDRLSNLPSNINYRLADQKIVLSADRVDILLKFLQDNKLLSQIDSIYRDRATLEDTLNYFYEEGGQ
ncbi:ABC transporter ATP-binding protein [Streptococcus sp. DD13]|uniref:ABC transporter ATP-binding protein n=1 Tax=Streptococcus sp. DD13 TaxID=1777881 RepID=UPI00079A9F95|nr:ABC transporter ATP-binding protein [Streptococcus sp. DD13]KXT77881.1 ABC transporter, ATP-binding protein [Streptococcus sp. DD13]